MTEKTGSEQQITRCDRSIIACLRHIYVWVLFSAHFSFVVNRTFNATPTERLQQHPLLFTTNRTAVKRSRFSVGF